MKKNPFTLIELLVVVAIIAVLAGMLLPALGKAMERSNSATCLSNLKQITMFHTMYGMDNNDWTYPTYRKDAAGRDVHWMNRFALDYNMSKLLCPEEDTAKWSCATPEENPTSSYNNNYAYGNNSELFGYSHTSGWSNFTKFTTVLNRVSKAGARPIAFTDTTTQLLRNSDGRPCFRASAVTGTSDPALAVYTYPGQTSGSYPIYARHNDAANCAFLDGSAAAVRRETIVREYKKYLRPVQKNKVWVEE